MSLIGLRRQMQRQGKRTAIVFVVLSLGLLAAHHTGLHGGHGDAAQQHGATSAGHDVAPAPGAPSPDGGGAGIVAMCLAVLPLVLALVLAAVAAIRLRGWSPARLGGGREPRLHRPRGAGAARAGPRDLCVMRC